MDPPHRPQRPKPVRKYRCRMPRPATQRRGADGAGGARLPQSVMSRLPEWSSGTIRRGSAGTVIHSLTGPVLLALLAIGIALLRAVPRHHAAIAVAVQDLAHRGRRPAAAAAPAAPAAPAPPPR